MKLLATKEYFGLAILGQISTLSGQVDTRWFGTGPLGRHEGYSNPGWFLSIARGSHYRADRDLARHDLAASLVSVSSGRTPLEHGEDPLNE